MTHTLFQGRKHGQQRESLLTFLYGSLSSADWCVTLKPICFYSLSISYLFLETEWIQSTDFYLSLKHIFSSSFKMKISVYIHADISYSCCKYVPGYTLSISNQKITESLLNISNKIRFIAYYFEASVSFF